MLFEICARLPFGFTSPTSFSLVCLTVRYGFMISSQLLSEVFSRFLSSRIGRGASLIALALLLYPASVLAQPVAVSVPDTSVAPGDTVAVPVQVDNLDEAASVVAYAFNLSFDTTDVSYAGYEDENTLTGEAGYDVVENEDTPRIAVAGTTILNDLADSGELIRVLMTVEGGGSTTVTLTSLEFNEGSPSAEPAEPSFELTGEANAPPEVNTSLPDKTLQTPGPALQLTDLDQSVFTDPDGDALSISASSGNTAVASVSTGSSGITLTPQATGQAQITVTATDPSNATVTETFTATVENRPDGEDVPTELVGAVVGSSQSGSADASFGDTGVEVQHQGPDASGFENAGFVEGAGTSTTSQRYQYRLSGLEPGTHRFRLQQRDTDGTTSLTDPVTLSIEAERALTFETTGPNPVRQETQLTFTVKQNGPARVNLYNLLGQQVRTLFDQTATVGDRYTVEVDASGLPTGKYFAQLAGPSGTRTQQIVVVR